VRATLVFYPQGRAPVRETHELGMTQGSGGAWLIDSDQPLPSS
jgi:hypothetical protein